MKKKLSFNNNNECAHAEKAGNLLVLIYSLQVKEYDMNSIGQRNKNLDERVALPPPINQQQSEKKKKNSLGIVKEKEEQEKVSTCEEEEEEAEGGGSQAETSKTQRGKYRQYEDSQVVIEKIRSYRTQRYPDSEIMKLLDNMPRRTYYNYVKKLQEQDKQITEQWISENVEHFAEELMIYRESLCQNLRELQGIIDNKVTAPKDKMQAIGQYFELSEKLYKFEKSGRTDSMNSVKHSFPSLY
ncbi:MAG: hypothetical protein M3114_03240 [Thermoproteota archaeon]|nr:hypothetical protein [Thermoproteota archaeon]